MLDHRFVGDTTIVGLDEALGRRLADDVLAVAGSPRFDNSAMDGFAVGSAGCGPWKVIGTVAAGATWTAALAPDEAVQIFTGAKVPHGTYAVVRQEDATVDGQNLVAEIVPKPGANVRIRGEEFSEGDLLLPAQTRVTPAVLSALASQGVDQVRVVAAPRVAILSTGSELAPLGKLSKPGMVFESNSYALRAMLRAAACPVSLRHVEDDPEEMLHHIEDLLESNDLLITIGGVSAGRFDFVRQSVLRAGVAIAFEGVSMKPGKPVAFGLARGAGAWFGLPGNPLSAQVTFCLLVAAWLGEPPNFRSIPSASGVRCSGDRDEFVPARIDWRPSPHLDFRPAVGSHATLALVGAEGLARIPKGVEQVIEGDLLAYAPLPWLVPL